MILMNASSFRQVSRRTLAIQKYVMQVYANLQICETQHGLLTMDGDLRVNQNSTLPASWTDLQKKRSTQHITSGEESPIDIRELMTSDLDIADMVGKTVSHADSMQLC